MGKIYYILLISLLLNSLSAQKVYLDTIDLDPKTETINSNYTQPPKSNVRTMAEWEEVKGVFITWNSNYSPSIHKIYAEIVLNVQKECIVYIVTKSPQLIKDELTDRNIPLTNVKFLNTNFDSPWVRDYGPNTVYTNDVDTLLLVNGIYNKPNRKLDNEVCLSVSDTLLLPLYSMTTNPFVFNFIGGNFMTDGLNKAFSSKLLLKDNISSSTIDKLDSIQSSIVNQFLGIKDYVLLDTLNYDNIHHLDLNMKLLDEETILVGQFPYGKSDYFKIEKNIDYIEKNIKSSFNTNFKIIRIPMASDNGYYPPESNARFKSYVNAVFVNNLILVPIYGDPNDAIALDIWKKSKPGYSIVGINCNAIVGYQGALHCITKEVGVENPLWITHKKPSNFANDSIHFKVKLKHKFGIENATIYYRFDNEVNFRNVDLDLDDIKNNLWIASLTKSKSHKKIEYFIEAKSNNGKVQKNPLGAPEALHILNIETSTGTENLNDFQVSISPNPAQDYLNINMNKPIDTYIVTDILGKVILEGDGHHLQNIILDLNIIPSNLYMLTLKSNNNITTKNFIKR